jgi:hypothetical protein
LEIFYFCFLLCSFLAEKLGKFTYFKDISMVEVLIEIASLVRCTLLVGVVFSCKYLNDNVVII